MYFESLKGAAILIDKLLAILRHLNMTLPECKLADQLSVKMAELGELTGNAFMEACVAVLHNCIDFPCAAMTNSFN